MSMISEIDREQLREHFAQNLSGEVTVTFFTRPETRLYVPGRECPYCRQTGELLEEVTSLSEKLHLQVHDFYSEPERAAAYGIDRIPAFLLDGAARGKVRYFGIPAGHEFPALIEGLVEVSKGSSSLSDESREALANLSRAVHIQVFVTPT